MTKPFLLFLIELFLFSSCYPQLTSSINHHNNFTDLESLLTFKSQLSDPHGILASNWSANTSFCSWMGITCSRRRQRVTGINFRNLPLQGTISVHLGNLSFLSSLVLLNCSLVGPIPGILSWLPRLSTLALPENSLSGSIPSAIFNMSSLTRFYIYNNNLVGSLPSNNHSFIMLPRVQELSLSGNHLTGVISSSIAGSRDLHILSVSENNFTGTIVELCSLPELEVIYFADNLLTGEIPTCLGNLSNLNRLDLSWNFRITGKIPSELGNLLNLQLLYLATNELTGSVPISLLNASMVNFLDFSNNQLTGPVPVGVGKSLPLLGHLSLGNNRLNGRLDFITSLSNCRNLNEQLELSENEFEGVLPESVGNLSTKLEFFHIMGNHIIGSIPVGISNLSALNSLDLSKNELTGEIPPELARLKGLTIMNLSHNSLSGCIPTEFGRLRTLANLDLSSNGFSGSIPDSLGNITDLQSLSIDHNNLSSSIPPSLWKLNSLIYLKLGFNFLDAMFPLGGLKVLNQLDLSNNRFSGNIPGLFGKLTMLSYLDLSNNSFNGSIPMSFGELINIEHLNLSHNLLSGAIPKSLANLRYISHLDLSFNKLKGQIPQGNIFSNQTISSLQGNQELCGAPQLGFPQCSEDIGTSNVTRKWHLFKYIISAIGSILIFLAICICLLLKFFRRRQAKSPSTNGTTWLHNHRMISYHELLRATENFSEANLLGRGAFSSVFKACLDDGMHAAVKVFNLEIEGASKSFEVECQALSTVRHRNLVKIISTCSNLDFKSLILQFIPNGSLENWLHSHHFYLNLLQRINIIVDVSLALEHLHHNHPHVVVHQDLKPSNVLLDENLVAYVGDFGIAKFLFGDSMAALSSSAQGTIGYMAPEYGCEGKISRRGDVYSFGILLLETFTRKKPTDELFTGELSLRQWVSEAHPNRVLEIVDCNILRDHSVGERTPQFLVHIQECLSSIMELGLLCSKDAPKERILMNEVVPRLQKIKMEYLAK